jgi:short-subunit dehydrogenase
MPRVAVVTGASSGIGEATARALARAGAAVVLAARREERLETLAEELRGRGGGALAVRCDVTRLEDLERLRDETLRAFGRCDVLVNNAGIPSRVRFPASPVENDDRVVATNLGAVLRGTKVFLPSLEEARGHVVNVASLAGLFVVPGAAVYSATKHAVVAFSEALLASVAPRVAVTAVCPGFVHTEGFPTRGTPRAITTTAEAVADRIVDVIRRRRIGTVCIPAWTAPFAAIQSLAPGFYRWAVTGAARRAARGI